MHRQLNYSYPNFEMSSKTSKSQLTLEQRYALINDSDSGMSQRKLSEKYNISLGAVNKNLKRKRDITDAHDLNVNPKSKQMTRNSKFEEINEKTLAWFQAARARNIPISGSVIQTKALEVAKFLQNAEFKGSNGWLESFTNRYQISFRFLSGESAGVDMCAVASWQQALNDIVKEYNLDDIYNCDETGILFRSMPTKSYVEKNDTAHGIKGSKERITVLLCCNMSGTDKCKPMVIGKSLRPRCFKNIDPKSLPVDYQANKKAWMNSVLFTQWLNDFDKKMHLQNRQVLLFLDNATSHPHVKLTNVKLKFFPPNCTSHLQPLDQGIICNLKVHYRKKLLQRVLTNIDSGATATELVKVVNIMDAIHWIHQAWGLVTSETIMKCFIKSGFPSLNFSADDLLDVQEVDTELQELINLANIEMEIYTDTTD